MRLGFVGLDEDWEGCRSLLLYNNITWQRLRLGFEQHSFKSYKLKIQRVSISPLSRSLFPSTSVTPMTRRIRVLLTRGVLLETLLSLYPFCDDNKTFTTSRFEFEF